MKMPCNRNQGAYGIYMKNYSTYVAAGLLVIAGIALAAWHGTNRHVPVMSVATPSMSPTTLATKYISVVDWPPKAQVTTDPFICTQDGSETARAGKTEQKTINGTTYCITTSSEGAAGSVYTQYAYAFPQHNKTVILTFSLRFVQCANYDQPAQKECQTERAAFTPDTILDQIAHAVQTGS